MNGDQVKASLKESLAAGNSSKLHGHTFQEIAVASILAYILEGRPVDNVSSEGGELPEKKDLMFCCWR